MITTKKKGCGCIAYESAEEDDYAGMGACHCGHSPEDHPRGECEWSEDEKPAPIAQPRKRASKGARK